MRKTMQAIFRKAQIDDIVALVNFNQLMAKETEDKQLDSHILHQGVSGLVNDSNKGFYLVAEVNNQVVGSLMVTKEWSDWRNADFWWIQSVYIIPQFRRKGLYSGLYNHVKELAEQSENVCGYRLYVENDNRVAQRTYESLGMHQSHYLMYESE
jgi:ribosomal protein S18 acetylase RimI-like enzyme